MGRIRTIRTEVIVLRERDFGEADCLLTLLTPGYGKLSAIAKGVRRPSSRKAGHLDLYMRSDVLLAKGRNLDVVTQAETLDAYRPVREDLLRSSYATYGVELLDRFTPEREANPSLYQLLTQALGWISTSENLPLTARYYELQLLALVGFMPELHHCVVNGELVEPEDQFFDPVAGGAVCPSCGDGRSGGQSITMSTLKILRFLQRSAYSALADLRVRPPVEAELEQVLLRYITVLLERQVKSVDFLKHVRRLAHE